MMLVVLPGLHVTMIFYREPVMEKTGTDCFLLNETNLREQPNFIFLLQKTAFGSKKLTS